MTMRRRKAEQEHQEAERAAQTKWRTPEHQRFIAEAMAREARCPRKLLTVGLMEKLLARLDAHERRFLWPAAKFFLPGSKHIWLISEMLSMAALIRIQMALPASL
jgi:hypothetical protein